MCLAQTIVKIIIGCLQVQDCASNYPAHRAEGGRGYLECDEVTSSPSGAASGSVSVEDSRWQKKNVLHSSIDIFLLMTLSELALYLV